MWFPVAWEDTEIRRTRQCRFPTIGGMINHCRDTALPIGDNLRLKTLINLAFTPV